MTPFFAVMTWQAGFNSPLTFAPLM